MTSKNYIFVIFVLICKKVFICENFNLCIFIFILL